MTSQHNQNQNTLATNKVSVFAKEINQLLQNPKLKHQLLNPVANFWDILEYSSSSITLKKENYETDWARMLRWLLDPNASHNLGTLFLDLFTKLVIRRKAEQDIALNNGLKYAFNYYQNGFSQNTISETERVIKGTKQRIDIRISDENKVLIVECKVGNNDDSEAQLDDYFDEIENNKIYENKHKFFAFLTPGNLPETYLQRDEIGNTIPKPPNNAPKHGADFASITYSDLEPILEQCVTQTVWNDDLHAKKIIEDFYWDLKRMLRYEPSPSVSSLWNRFPGEITLATTQLDNTKKFEPIIDPIPEYKSDKDKEDSAAAINDPNFFTTLQNEDILNGINFIQWHNLLSFLWQNRRMSGAQEKHLHIAKLIELVVNNLSGNTNQAQVRGWVPVTDKKLRLMGIDRVWNSGKQSFSFHWNDHICSIDSDCTIYKPKESGISHPKSNWFAGGGSTGKFPNKNVFWEEDKIAKEWIVTTGGNHSVSQDFMDKLYAACSQLSKNRF